MSNTKYLWGAALLALAASCAQEETVTSLAPANNEIAYKVDAGKMSRSSSAYTTGADIKNINVSAWGLSNANAVPAYGDTVRGNAIYFLNDLLAVNNNGVFTYQSDARFWPHNGETLDFYSLVDFGDEAFDFANIKKDAEGNDVKLPGVAGISQKQMKDMPDMLYAATFDQTAPTNKVAQKNVKFDFKHALAKVIVTAEVRNETLHIVITDMSIIGVTTGGDFVMTHKAADAENGVKEVPASWIVNPEYSCTLTNLLANRFEGQSEKKLVLDCADFENFEYGTTDETKKAKIDLVTDEDGLLVIPNTYAAKVDGKLKTYIQLKGYVFNINSNDNGFDDDTDTLIYGGQDDSGYVPMDINIPIDFDWAMGTVNKYNIVFDCGNGGTSNTGDEEPEDPDNPDPGIDPTFMRIGFESTVIEWEEKDPENYEYHGPEKK